MMRWVRSLFAWQLDRAAGIWIYEINATTGGRRATRCAQGGHSPLDWRWLLQGEGMPVINGRPAWRSAYRNDLPDGWGWF